MEDGSEVGSWVGGEPFRKMNNGVNSLPSYHVDNGRAHDDNSTKWTRTTPPQL